MSLGTIAEKTFGTLKPGDLLMMPPPSLNQVTCLCTGFDYKERSTSTFTLAPYSTLMITSLFFWTKDGISQDIGVVFYVPELEKHGWNSWRLNIWRKTILNFLEAAKLDKDLND